MQNFSFIRFGVIYNYINNVVCGVLFFCLSELIRNSAFAPNTASRFRPPISLVLALKVCPHLYANTNEACGTRPNPNKCQKKGLFGICLVKRMPTIANVFFFEVPAQNRWCSVHRMFATQTNAVHCASATRPHQHFSHIHIPHSAFAYRRGRSFRCWMVWWCGTNTHVKK